MQDRIEALAQKLDRAGVTFEVLIWNSNRYDWCPDLNAMGQPLMRYGTRPCHWRLERWSEDGHLRSIGGGDTTRCGVGVDLADQGSKPTPVGIVHSW